MQKTVFTDISSFIHHKVGRGKRLYVRCSTVLIPALLLQYLMQGFEICIEHVNKVMVTVVIF